MIFLMLQFHDGLIHLRNNDFYLKGAFQVISGHFAKK